MSIRNNDRHGLGDLKHEGTKITDRIKIPPWVIYILVFGIFIIISFKSYTAEELDLEKLQRRNVLLAMKK